MCLTHPYVPPAEIADGAGAAVLANSARLWDNGAEITYGFMPPFSGAPKEQAKVHKIIKEWMLFVNLTFTYVLKPEDAMIRISFSHSEKVGSWSYVARDCLDEAQVAKDKPTMNLGWLDDTKEPTKNDKGLVLHEFGHAIGLLHEHQSPARDEVITLKVEPTIAAYTSGAGPNKWTREDVITQIIKPVNEGEYTNYTDLDTTSIMMYFMPAEMNDQGVEIPPNNALSDYDRAFVLIHYPLFEFSERTDGWDFQKALTVMGIEGEGRENVLEKYSAGDVPGVREEFSKAYESVRTERNALRAAELKA
jgi:hypothetical protein